MLINSVVAEVPRRLAQVIANNGHTIQPLMIWTVLKLSINRWPSWWAFVCVDPLGENNPLSNN
jgi:hypothetical protein